MRSSIPWLQKQVACCLLISIVPSLADAATPSLPLAPSAIALQAQAQAAAPQTGGTATEAGQPEPSPHVEGTPGARPSDQQQSSTPTDTPTDQQSIAPVPVGTAAAPVVRSNGVPASRPAGAAIAPAKQHRTRSFAIRVGLIVGAAIAIGAVTAASLSSSSRPH
jgi:hypothetical protein